MYLFLHWMNTSVGINIYLMNAYLINTVFRNIPSSQLHIFKRKAIPNGLADQTHLKYYFILLEFTFFWEFSKVFYCTKRNKKCNLHYFTGETLMLSYDTEIGIIQWYWMLISLAYTLCCSVPYEVWGNLENGYKWCLHDFVKIPEVISGRLHNWSGWIVVSLPHICNPGTEMWLQQGGLFLSVQLFQHLPCYVFHFIVSGIFFNA